MNNTTTNRRDRLHQLFELARSYRNLTLSELAARMDRSPSNILRQGDNPKLDLIIGLANCLDWTIDEVTRFIWSGKSTAKIDHQGTPASSGPIASLSFANLENRARQAREEGRLGALIETVDQMQKSAKTVKQRASVLLSRAIIAAASGNPSQQEHAGQQLVIDERLPQEFKLMGLAQIAQANLSLGRLSAANDHAKAVIRHTQDLVFDIDDEVTCEKYRARAAAQEVRGHLACRQLNRPIGRWKVNTAACRRDASQARRWLDGTYDEVRPDHITASITRCNAALTELDVALGNMQADDAVAMLQSQISEQVPLHHDLVESLGWVCVYGADIAMRFMSPSRQQQCSLGTFSEKGFELADRIDGWQLRERLLTLDYEGNKILESEQKKRITRIIDNDDVRLINSTMRRFPNFRSIGLDILTNSELSF